MSAGSCTCREVVYHLTSAPMFVNCCHCRWCQRETGTAFALNAIIEADRVIVDHGAVETIDTPTLSGEGQRVSRCPRCRIALWSNYAGAGPTIHFVRVGTLDEPDRFAPGAFIFTASKQPWVVLPADIPAFTAYYERDALWPADSLARRARARASLALS